jgi:cytidylate kinase
MSKINIITIERQFASGGRQVGSLVAQELGFKFYNEEILQLASQKLNTQPQNVEHLEEVLPNSLLYGLAMATDFNSEGVFADRLFQTESEIIRNIAVEGKCVIVGRCAGQILATRKDVLNVFIYADEDTRIARAVNEYGVPEKEVHTRLSKIDKRRNSFYNVHTRKQWGDMGTYDLCLDSGRLGIETCTEIIKAAVNR